MLTPEQSHTPARTSSAPHRRPRRHNARPASAGAANTARSNTESTAVRPPAQAVVATPDADVSFAELGIAAPLIEKLVARGVREPFPIQAATLPDTLAGKDVLGRGRTGSGKTLAFVLPMVTRLAAAPPARRPARPRGLILVPTRELATQVHASLEPLADATGLRTTTVFGGVGLGKQINTLRSGIDILVACPGRLEELIRQGNCDLGGVEITVLDEADHMADLGFLPSVKRLMDRTPADGQRLLFSATLDNGVDVLVRRYMNKPVTHSVDPAVAPIATMVHHVFQVSADAKAEVVRELASGRDRSLLFTRTKSGARRLAKSLTAAGVPAVDLHGNLAQNARERNLAAFTTGKVRVLVATDIAARGVHVDDIALVVHVDPPAEHKAYLHRSGRTARAGAAGVVVTVATPDQQSDVRTLARQAGISPTTIAVRPGATQILALTGPPAEYVTPPPPAENTGSARQGTGTGGGRGTGRGRAGGSRATTGDRTETAGTGRSTGTGRAGGGRGGNVGGRGRAGTGGGRSGGLIYSSNSDGTSSGTAPTGHTGGAAAHSERSGGRRRRPGRAA